MTAVDICVVGGGAAGTMAALRAVLNARSTLLLTGDVDTRRRSRAQWVPDVENLPGYPGRRFPLTQDTQQVVEWVSAQPHLAGLLQVVKCSVEAIERQEDGFLVRWTERHRRNPEGTPHQALARAVILATGVMDEQPLIQGAIEPIYPFANAGEALYCLQSDGHRVQGHVTAVIGHTDHAAEVAITLHERYHPPGLLLVTHTAPPAISEHWQHLLDRYHIPIHQGPITALEGKARKPGLQAIVVNECRLPVTRLFVAIGLRVYSQLAEALGIDRTPEGFIVTDANGQTSLPGIYAVGDVQAGARRQIYAAWDQAVTAVEHIDHSLRLALRPHI